MPLLRFLFGHGWWVLYHLFFYLTLLLTVVLTLIIFGQELKRPGEPPDLPSPGSMMVFMIGLGLGFVTLLDAAIFSRVLPWPWYGKLALILGLPLVVCVVIFPLNNMLAIRQSRPAFWANVAVSVTVVLLNLTLLYRASARQP